MPRLVYDKEAIEHCRRLWIQHGGNADMVEREMRREYPAWRKQLLHSRGLGANYREGWIKRWGFGRSLEIATELAVLEGAGEDAIRRLKVRKICDRLLTDGLGADTNHHDYYLLRDFLKLDERLKENAERERRKAEEARTAEEANNPHSAIPIPQFPDWLPEVSPKLTWDWDYQIYLYERLAQVTSGEVDRLMVFMPPRHGKSTVATIHYAAWRILHNPATRVIVGAYAQKLANKFSRAIRRLVEPRCPLLDDANKVEEWETCAGGGVLAVGRGAGVTGYGADLIILDDTVKSRAEAESDTYRENTWDWYGADIYTRQEPNCAIVVVNTRWHCDDICGRLIDEQAAGGDEWEIVSLPALAEENDPLGRELGAVLCPERGSEKFLARMKAKMSPYDFSALYQQNPIPQEGAIFKVDWFKTENKAPEGLRWVRYYDLAASIKTSADYTCSVAAAFDKEGNLWLRDMLRGRWEWPDAKREIMRLMAREKNVLHGFESNAFQLVAVQELRRERLLFNVPFRAVKVTTDKLSRALPWAERAAEGKVKLVRGAWISAFLAECASFPKGAHDDQVDAVSGCVEMLAKGGGKKLYVFD